MHVVINKSKCYVAVNYYYVLTPIAEKVPTPDCTDVTGPVVIKLKANYEFAAAKKESKFSGSKILIGRHCCQSKWSERRMMRQLYISERKIIICKPTRHIYVLKKGMKNF